MAHGRKNMVAAGKWNIVGFYVTRTFKRCDCCGRIIRYVFQLEDAIANSRVSDTNAMPGNAEVGIVCGPRVFDESCKSFYDDPAKEWMRQFDRWANIVKYVILNAQNADVWIMVDRQTREFVDTLIDKLHDPKTTQEEATQLLRVRDAKMHILRTRRIVTPSKPPRGQKRVVNEFNFVKRLKRLKTTLNAFEIVDACNRR